MESISAQSHQRRTHVRFQGPWAGWAGVASTNFTHDTLPLPFLTTTPGASSAANHICTGVDSFCAPQMLRGIGFIAPDGSDSRGLKRIALWDQPSGPKLCAHKILS
jgi:hypothetical protein